MPRRIAHTTEQRKKEGMGARPSGGLRPRADGGHPCSLSSFVLYSAGVRSFPSSASSTSKAST